MCPRKARRVGFGEMSAPGWFPQEDALPAVRKPGVQAASAMTSAREYPAACHAGAKSSAVLLAAGHLKVS